MYSNKWIIDNQKEFFHNQLDSQWNQQLILPVIVVFAFVFNGVFGVDERNNIPNWQWFVLVDVTFIFGCNDRFLRFFLLADDDE